VPFYLATIGMYLCMFPGQVALLLPLLGAVSIAWRLVFGLGADLLGGKRDFILSFIPRLQAFLLLS
jgi:hypothetical protein